MKLCTIAAAAPPIWCYQINPNIGNISTTRKNLIDNQRTYPNRRVTAPLEIGPPANALARTVKPMVIEKG